MKETDRAQGLTNVLSFNDDMLATALTDITDDLARRQLRDGGPSIAWLVGHMLHHRNQIAAAIRCAGPAIDLTQFVDAATDGRDYPAVDQLRTAWATSSTRLVQAVSTLSDEGLSAPSPIARPHGEQTLLDALRFLVWHETLHLGQVSMLRSHQGLTPLVRLVRERAAAVHA